MVKIFGKINIMADNKINITEQLCDKKPISWLIRELQTQLENGNDYIVLEQEREFGDTIQVLTFSKA